MFNTYLTQRQEMLNEKSKKIMQELFSQGNSLAEMVEIANFIIINEKKALENPENTIGSLGHRLKI